VARGNLTCPVVSNKQIEVPEWPPEIRNYHDRNLLVLSPVLSTYSADRAGTATGANVSRRGPHPTRDPAAVAGTSDRPDGA